VIGLWGIFGIFNGFYGETFLIYTSDVTHGLDGFIYVDPLRKFDALFFHLSYLLSNAIGDHGSFVPYQIVYGALWFLRSVLSYLIVQRLMPDRPALAAFAGILAALHAADQSLNWVGELHQFGFIFLMLLSFFLLLLAVDSRRIISTVALAAVSALAGYTSLWSYESPLPVMLAFPFVVALLRRDVPFSRLASGFAIYLIPVVVFIGENAQRYLAGIGGGGGAYQSGLARQNFSLAALASDLWFHLENSVAFWQWPEAFFRSDRLWHYAIALLPVLAGILLVIHTAILAEERSTRSFRFDPRLLLFTCTSFALLIASYLVILVLRENRNLWRTEFLPSFSAACLGGAVLYAALSLVHRKAQRMVIAVVFMTAVSIFSVLAGVNSALHFHDLWERNRVVMSSIISNAPRIADGTLIVISNIDRQRDPFDGLAIWFDLAVRLAYPNTMVAGIYFYQDGAAAPGTIIEIKDGRPQLLPGGSGITTLFHWSPQVPISHLLVFDFDPATGDVSPVVTGLAKIKKNEIAPVDYAFCDAVTGSKPTAVAIHRYGPIAATHRIACAQNADQE
jgi:hypothetical protein